MSEPTELYEILERFAPILDDSDLADLSRMCREYAVNVHESRLSPPLAPVLEWEGTGFLGEIFVAGDWLLRPLRKYSPTRDSDVIAEWSITRHGYELTRRDTLEKAQFVASSIQRLLDET